MTPVDRLERWELFGARWRVRSLDGGRAVIELCSCHGEAVDEIRSDDPDLFAYIAGRPDSEHAGPGRPNL